MPGGWRSRWPRGPGTPGSLPRTAAARAKGLRAAWRLRVGNSPLKFVPLADDLGAPASGSLSRVLAVGPPEVDAGSYSVPVALLVAVEDYGARSDGVGRIRSLSRQWERLAGVCGARAGAPETEDSLEQLRGADRRESKNGWTASIRAGDGWRDVRAALGEPNRPFLTLLAVISLSPGGSGLDALRFEALLMTGQSRTTTLPAWS